MSKSSVSSPSEFDGGIASILRAASDVFGDRVVCVRQVVICGDKSVTTEVQLAAPSDRGEAA